MTGKWQVNYKDGEGWQDVDQKRAERIIREAYNPADSILEHAKETGENINTMFALYRFVKE